MTHHFVSSHSTNLKQSTERKMWYKSWLTALTFGEKWPASYLTESNFWRVACQIFVESIESNLVLSSVRQHRMVGEVIGQIKGFSFLPGFLQQHWGCSALPWLRRKTITSSHGVSLSWNIWEQRLCCGCAQVDTALFGINNEVAAYTCNQCVAPCFCRCVRKWQNRFEKISGLPVDWAFFPSYLQL